MPSKTRTWSVPTSPRNPYKLCDELGLLKKYEGKIWNKETQTEFANELSKADFFEGSIYAKEPDFSARDRVNRSPKTFGFIRLDDGRKITFTSAGNQLITKQNLEELFLRQLHKWQYSSPNHNGIDYSDFKIKPFLEMLRLVRELDGLSKKEIAIFGVTLIDFRNYERTKNRIINFRTELETTTGKRHRRALEVKTHFDYFSEVYYEEIASGDVSIRQGGIRNADNDKFLKTKMRNSVDYADAAMRYFRATGLFSLSSRNYRLKIIDTKLRLVDAILKSTKREPKSFRAAGKFLDLLGDNHLPKLPDDDEILLRKNVAEIIGRLVTQKVQLPSHISAESISSMDYVQLKAAKQELEETERGIVLDRQIFDLQSYSQYEDIIETFEKIGDRKDIDIPDKPLFFEWNIWRAMSMLDDGDIQANLRFDAEGKPFSGAPGKTADIVCAYKDFVLVVEVTLMSGHKQYEAEGEPVARHVADVRKKLTASGDKRPVFGLFIALQISEATAAHFFALRKTNIAFYGGSLDVIPVSLKDFEKVLSKAKSVGGVQSMAIKELIDGAANIADTATDEKDWQLKIGQSIEDWRPEMLAR